MVIIEGINVENMHFKLKTGRAKGLLKDIFGKEFAIDELSGSLYVRKRPNLFNYLNMSWPKSFLSVDLTPDKYYFKLRDEKYFNQTIEFAKKYEEYFGVEVSLVKDYSK